MAQWLSAAGFTRVQAERTDGDKKVLDVVADRFRLGSAERARVVEAIELALKRGSGRMAAYVLSDQELLAQDQKAPEADLADENAAPAVVAAKPTQQPWPAALPDQVRAVAEVLVHSSAPLSLLAIEARFKGRGPWKKGLPMLLQTLEVLGRAQAVQGGGAPAWRA